VLLVTTTAVDPDADKHWLTVLDEISGHARIRDRIRRLVMRETTKAHEASLEEKGFRKRYLLAGHPAYPDPLWIHPPTEENAKKYWEQYCKSTFEEYIERIGHTPFNQWKHRPMTAEDFNPRILVTWEYVAEKQEWTPEEPRCLCLHFYGSHVHPTSGSPIGCVAGGCGCRGWTPAETPVSA
jgi:hypothetical protein